MYDIIIIGGGPAGLTSAIYALEANKSVLILEKMVEGGQVSNLFNITNYPGFENIDGFELSKRMKNQAISLGAEFKREEVVSANLEEKTITTHKNTYITKNIIIASGAYAKPLDVENEKFYYGKGLSYCATCDGSFFKDKIVAVVGGGNSSIDDVLYLSNIASKIYLIHRREEFTANPKTLEKVKDLSKSGRVEILTNSIVKKIIGNNKIEGIEIFDKKLNNKMLINVDGLFVAIGRKPDTEIFAQQLELDAGGFIITDALMRTNLKNVYAVGDVRNTPLRQIITACADGAVAVSTIVKEG